MKFKVDENLPAAATQILRVSGHDAHTVWDESLAGAADPQISISACLEDRILITLDRDFADVHVYPPEQHCGIIVLRPKAQDEATVVAYVRRVLAAIQLRSAVGELWIVERDRIRIRRGTPN